jgi:hypothetical protein
VTAKRPPRLLVKTLSVTFVSVAMLLAGVFVVVVLSVRDQVRQTVTVSLESGQRIFAAIESRRERELRAQAATLAENPTLKATIDTYAAEVRTSDESRRSLLLNTMANELDKVAARVEADALILADTHQITLAASGRLADRWPRGRPVATAGAKPVDTVDGVIRAGGLPFRVVSVPLQLNDVPIATLYLATHLDQRYADDLEKLANARTVIISDGLIVASTLPSSAARSEFEAAAESRQPLGVVTLDGQSYAFRRLVQIGTTSFYALGSIDELSRAATSKAIQELGAIATVAVVLALVASFWLARMLTEPIGRLSASLAHAGNVHDARVTLSLTGSSRELDALTETFNALMASVATAEEQMQAAYTGSIRALAAALDARDPYTAGHSERVSDRRTASRAAGRPRLSIRTARRRHPDGRTHRARRRRVRRHHQQACVPRGAAGLRRVARAVALCRHRVPRRSRRGAGDGTAGSHLRARRADHRARACVAWRSRCCCAAPHLSSPRPHSRLTSASA